MLVNYGVRISFLVIEIIVAKINIKYNNKHIKSI